MIPAPRTIDTQCRSENGVKPQSGQLSGREVSQVAADPRITDLAGCSCGNYSDTAGCGCCDMISQGVCCECSSSSQAEWCYISFCC